MRVKRESGVQTACQTLTTSSRPDKVCLWVISLPVTFVFRDWLPVGAVQPPLPLAVVKSKEGQGSPITGPPPLCGAWDGAQTEAHMLPWFPVSQEQALTQAFEHKCGLEGKHQSGRREVRLGGECGEDRGASACHCCGPGSCPRGEPPSAVHLSRGYEPQRHQPLRGGAPGSPIRLQLLPAVLTAKQTPQ